MSTDDRHDQLPEFPGWQAPGAEGSSTPADVPAPPVADEPPVAGQAPVAERAPRPVEIPEPIEMPAAAHPEPEPEPAHEPESRPEPATEHAPIAQQATAAYDHQPIGGPYVTASEPEPTSEQPVAQDAPADRTPYPAAAFAPAAATAGAAQAGASPAPVSDGPPPYQPVPQPVQAPRPPEPKGNRGAGSLIALLGTAVFAVLFAVVSFFVIGANLTGEAAITAFFDFLRSAAFIVPVVVFALSLILIVLIVNRAGWWAYVLGGFLVAVLVYFAGIAGALVHVQAWTWQPQQQFDFVRSLTMDPLTLGGAIVAREVAIWTGALIALRGRRLKARNAAAREEWDRAQAEERASVDRAAQNDRPAQNPGEVPAPITTW
ncbi:hypothetical protein ITJ64_02845 [Herbiconiux sp. VKM Ac-1786]|uniref:hypothetical protein n=1 Tax=Herbiconiux sp. VKM Ac-1786 TaxID=2783824 RepID=UPI00188B2F84|nr:hypothetical protein [Herbiconiux sp. VKM Ac-1786]MBF4571446.1 hypothetical protein [Herbiconiux sp. VKM Ac-1786]